MGTCGPCFSLLHPEKKRKKSEKRSSGQNGFLCFGYHLRVGSGAGGGGGSYQGVSTRQATG